MYSEVKKILSLWGENSLKILCLHGFVIQVIRLLDFKILHAKKEYKFYLYSFYFEGCLKLL